MKHEILRDSKVEAIAAQSSKNGKALCGDDYFFLATDDYFICVLADGLGSGEFAHESSRAVTDVVRDCHEEDVDSLMDRCNRVLVQKRGAAVAIFKVYFKEKRFRYSCVGNIRFYLYPPNGGKLVYPLPVTGYMSGRKQHFHTQEFSYIPNSRFLIHSDGFEMRGTKNFFGLSGSLEVSAKQLEHTNSAASDDITFIFGSLLE
ncbi:phosphoserine phosphatase [Bacillus sp. FJAT-27916]|uniref:PP2C family serine/threonine-protein phosphatase n=1 Tax=Bacillaceae TaxID=186817 RepID=UPI000670BFA1|nr:PP2C family serine/threonine-protein phosphatase [Bacillus sp. FJAT-27916]KMY45989.1 phosphoserine phosphatase [Bacillus sp. FJAT-27916]